MSTINEFSAFIAKLVLAIPRFAPTLSESQIEIWYEQLGDLTTEELSFIYYQAIARYEEYPSIRQLLELAGRTPASPKDIGSEVAERIFQALSKFGAIHGKSELAKNKHDQIAQFLGPVGARIALPVWNNICESVTYKNESTYKAQWRDAAVAFAKSGHTSPDELDKGPDFPARLHPDVRNILVKARNELKTADKK